MKKCKRKNIERDRNIAHLYNSTSYTLAEIAKIYKISPERVRQISYRAAKDKKDMVRTREGRIREIQKIYTR